MIDRKVSVLPWVPHFAQGLVRDLRVRWALEEAGLTYQERILGQDYKTSVDYRALQPFGQVPAYEENGLTMFESGAIVLHIAERSPALMPGDSVGQARAKSWMFCALNTLEPPITDLILIDFAHGDEEWATLRRPGAIKFVQSRLDDLAAWLGNKSFLEDRFTAGDLLMTSVLRELRHTELVRNLPNLDDYRRRCEDRPAFQKALTDQLATFDRHAHANRSPATEPEHE